MCTRRVVKRNGYIQDFDIYKIIQAVFNASNNIDLAKDVANIVDETLSDEQYIKIEHIQDLIEAILMDKDKSVAKDFIIYREKRRQIRYMKAQLFDESQAQIDEILNNKNIENANANVDESSFSGKNARVNSYFLKHYALDNLIDKDIAKAHKEGRLYIHDLDNYASGMHNCLNVDFTDLFENNGGFATRNGDVRKPKDIMTFFQLVAVVFQCESQVQYGGVGANKIDYDAVPYVKITFKKAFKDALIDVDAYTEDEAQVIMDYIGDRCCLENEWLMKEFDYLYSVAKRHTERKTLQAAESLYHNLNTLESRAGSQVPFTSINFGTCIEPEGRLVSKSLLQASINGIGKYHTTSIFPISIFKHKKGVNDVPGTPNYDLKQLAIQSLSKRIYPNFVNCDASYLIPANSPDEEHATMGCRTLIGYDRHGLGNAKGGRGNVAPTTINLVELGIQHGICFGKPLDLRGFWNDLDKILALAEKSLVNRFNWIASQKAKSAFFLHENGLMKNTLGRKLNLDEEVKESMKHNTLAIGYIGIAEMCVALFGKTHANDDFIHNFAYEVVEYIHKFTKQASERNDLNFSCYATPAESTCMTLRNKLAERYGVIKGITDRKYITNSHHIPVYEDMSIYEKIQKEAPFQKLANGGCIMYTEIDSAITQNLNAIEKIINYAMENDIAYFAINFPIDTCKDCGYSSEINEDNCPQCNSTKIERLRRVTGYLTTDYRKFNDGKIDEVKDRVKHMKEE